MKSQCPHTDSFALDGTMLSARRIIEVLGPMILEERRERIAEVVAGRSYTVVPVLEGLYDRGNVSAVLRSAEALGFQSVHIVESSEKFKRANRVTQGAQKWLDISTWKATAPCVEHLREQGYRILATHVESARPIAEIAFDTPTALFFGNEKDGLSDELLACADERVVVPMPGFTRSFNISVAAALCLYHVHRDRVGRLGAQGDLTEDEQRYLTASYYLRSFDYAERLLLRQGKMQNDGRPQNSL